MAVRTGTSYLKEFLMKRWFKVLTSSLAVVLFITFSCAAFAAAPVKLRTAWLDEHEAFLVWYAKEKGWDKEEGLDIEMLLFSSGMAQLNALPAGEWVLAGTGAVPGMMGALRYGTYTIVFWLETRDQQISRFAQSGLGRETVNAGKSRSLGAEISLAGAVTTNFTLTANYGYTYATFKEYVTNAKSADNKVIEISYNGNYVPFVPKHTLSLGGQYIFRINPGHWLDRIQLNANYTGAGRIYWTEQNDVSQAFYGTLNGRLSLQKGNGQIDFWVRNALDKDYAAFYFESMGNGFMQKGRPIQAGIELRCRF